MAEVSCGFFFFQAEDGIRDYKVTGVQTCALPIYSPSALFHVRTNTDENLWVRSASRINMTAANDAGSAFAPFSIESSSLLINSGSGGNVGIGTVTPGQKLDVLGGNINVSANGGVGGDITLTGTIHARYQDVAEWV